MKIAICGDSHDHHENLMKAVEIANENSCELILHTGDLGAAGRCSKILKRFKGQVKMVLGNNDHELIGLMRRAAEIGNLEIIKTNEADSTYEGTIDGVRIYMHHYPRMAELAAHSGQFDLCIFGHTHVYHEEAIGETLLLNPSSLHPTTAIPSMVIYDTSNRSFEKIMI